MADARTDAHTSRRKKPPEKNLGSLTTLALVQCIGMMVCCGFNIEAKPFRVNQAVTGKTTGCPAH
jgi:hypothetical protein